MSKTDNDLRKIHNLIHQPSYACVYPEDATEGDYEVERRILNYIKRREKLYARKIIGELEVLPVSLWDYQDDDQRKYWFNKCKMEQLQRLDDRAKNIVSKAGLKNPKNSVPIKYQPNKPSETPYGK